MDISELYFCVVVTASLAAVNLQSIRNGAVVCKHDYLGPITLI
jgi:hypothetical protein